MTNYIANFTLSEPKTINATFKIVTVTEATGLSYGDLNDLPSINNVTLLRNKTSTDLGLAPQSTTYTKTEVDSKIAAIPTPDVSAQITAHNSSETAHSDIRTTLSNKVDKSGTKQLSDENFTSAEKIKLSGIETGAQVNPDLTPYAKTTDVNTALSGKSDTTHNHTLASLSEKSYNSLSDTPTIPTQYTDAMAQSALSSQLATKVDKNGTQTLTDNNLTNALKTSYDGAVTKSNIIVLNGDGSKYLADDGIYKTVESGSSLTEAQQTILANTSGINTGDETNSSIKTKLGTDLSDKYDSSNFIAGTDYLATGGQVKTVLETLTTTDRLNATAIQHFTPKNIKLGDISTRVYFYMNAGIALSAGVATKLPLNVASVDNLGECDTVAYKYTAKFTQVVDFVFIPFLSTITTVTVTVYINGSAAGAPAYGTQNGFNFPLAVTAGKYYEFYVTSAVANYMNAYTTVQLFTKGT